MKSLFFLLCVGLLTHPAFAAERPHWEQTPLYGTHGLGEMVAEAGGSYEISALAKGCTGYINPAQPDMNIELAADGPLTLAVNSPGDTVLLVYTPTQEWLCADDVSDTALNPVLNIPQAAVGSYNIWLGTHEAGQALKATLTATQP
jgi:hypothetical protein